MSFYDDASIIMVPSGYKTSKVYCAKPTDGSGDLTFTRTGSTATRVNESGLIEECRTNLVLNSATLATQNVTVVAAPYTLSIFGTGSVTLSGTGTGTLTGTGAANRVSLTFTPTAGTLTLTISGSVTSAQLEIGDIATNYIPTTTAAVTVGPIANLPRLDYTGGGCPKLLMEPTRTNLFNYSESFNNNSWLLFNSALILSNQIVSPDGYINADKLTFATSANSQIAKNISNTSNTFTVSVYARSTTSKKFRFKIWTGTVDLSSSDITTTNQWVRYSYTFTSATSDISFLNESSGGVGDIFIYGAQLEIGAYASSYIPTWNASVTRNEDSFLKTSISSLLGQTEGSLFLDFIYEHQNGGGAEAICLSDGTTANRVIIRKFGANNISALLTSSSVNVGPFNKIDAVVGQRYKCAIAYKLNDIVFYVNGQLVGSLTTGAVPASLSQIASNAVAANTSLNEPKNQILVFKTRLSNTDLATLTTI